MTLPRLTESPSHPAGTSHFAPRTHQARAARRTWLLRTVFCTAFAAAVMATPTIAQETAVAEPATAVTADNNITAAAALPNPDRRFSQWIAIALNDTAQAETALRLALASEWTLLQHPEKTESSLTAITQSGKHSAMDKNLALRVLAKIKSRTGDRKQVTDLARQTGCMPLWLSGPWGHFVHANFDMAFEPEEKIDLAQAPDQSHPGWTLLPLAAVAEPFEPWQRVWPDKGDVYVFAQCAVSTDTEALLWINTACAAKIWIDDEKAPLTINRLDVESGVEQVWRMPLSAGNHRFLVKLHPMSHEHDTALRLTGIDGVANPSIQWDSTSKSLLPLTETNAKNDSPEPAFTLAADAKQDNGNSALLAERYLVQQLYDKASTEVNRLVSDDASNALWKSLQLRIEANNPNLPPLMRDRNADAIIKNLRAADLYPGHLAAIKRDLAQNRDQQALASIEALLKRWPAATELHDLRCRLALERKWQEQADLWIKAMKQALPEAAQPYLHEATLSIETQNAGGCAQAYAEASRRMPFDARIVLAQARAWQNAGKPEQATKTLQDSLAIMPTNPELLLELGKTLLQQDQTAEALTLLQQATAGYPRNPDLWQTQGDVQYRRGDKDGAVSSYRNALDLDPGRHELRRLWCKLSGTPYDFWTPYAISAAQQLKETAKLKLPGTTARLIDQTVLEIYPDGSFANFTHELQKVIHPSGVAEAGKVRFAGELLSARTILPDGKAVEPMRLPGENTLTMPALEQYAAVEYEYLDTEKSSFDGSVRFPKWYFRSPDTKEAFLLSQYVIRVPVAYPFQFSAHNLGRQVQFSKEEKDGMMIYTWTGKNMPRADHEEDSTSIDERLPFVEISGKRTWKDVNNILRNEYLGAIRPTRDIVEFCAVLGNAPDLCEALRASVVRIIKTEGRYRNAAHIMAAQRGDRNILLLSLLRCTPLIFTTSVNGVNPKTEVRGIVYAACRPPESRLVSPDWTMPSADYFTDRLVGIKTNNGIRWLDTTTEHPAPCGVPSHLQGGTAFIIDDNGGRFITLPTSDTHYLQSQQELVINLNLLTNDLSFTGTRLIVGDDIEALEKLQHQPVREQIRNFEDRMRLLFADIVTTKLQTQVQKDGTIRQAFAAESRLGGLTEEPGGAQSLRMPLLPLALFPAEDENRRETDFHRMLPQSAFEQIRIDSDSLVTLSSPRTVLLKSMFGTYRLCVRINPSGVTIEREYDFPPCRVPIDQWGNYMDFCRQIRRAETDPLRFKNR